MMSPMDITIGFVNTPREISIENVAGGDDIKSTIAAKLAEGSGVLELADAAGKTYLAQVDKISYVQVGASAPRKVGFIA